MMTNQEIKENIEEIGIEEVLREIVNLELIEDEILKNFFIIANNAINAIENYLDLN